MDLICDERPSDSPFVERIWRSESDYAVPFISIANSHWEIVVTKYQSKTILTIRGPETKATSAYGLAEAQFLGIEFKAGVFMPKLPASIVMDRHDLNLPEATSQSFWLNHSVWQYPDFENADTFVDRLERNGLLVRDKIVDAAVNVRPVSTSRRTVQRRFLQATGLTHTTILQIERARYATRLLKQGTPIPDTVYQAGYFDQPHLTRSLKHLIGLTPAQIAEENRIERLSFLYKTDQLYQVMIGISAPKPEEDNRPRALEAGWRFIC